ncbi:MAG: UDP-N-acetylmuramoyl-L-alanine--D-glutamate ligase [Patescibacteria group bacterium]|nr:UDP-N-acetylmuramoyl-L-alanine--D-glutamate ligase [Patescibacteria group bacterium]
MKLNKLKNKKILILGLGIEGMDTLKFLRKSFPQKVIAIGDKLRFNQLNSEAQTTIKKDKKLRLHLGESYLGFLKYYDSIIKTPGIPPKVLKPFLEKGQKITSQTEIFFNNCKGKIIGITATKGKSTTASLIYEILKKNKLKAYLVGNIGKPMLSLLSSDKKENVYVCELSSHQLVSLKKSPDIAVFLNIYSEHLDYYENFKQYLSAKSNITKHQGKNDYLVFNSKNKLINQVAKKSKAQKIPISSVKIKRIETLLKGEFNVENIKAAIAATRLFKIKDKDILKAIKTFKPLAHRLECIGTYKGIKFYNDALSTVPEATIAALDALGNNVETIFLGGLDRGIDFKGLAKRILKSRIKVLILFPDTGGKIYKQIVELDKNSKFKAIMVLNMKDGVKLAYEHTKKGKICLLSTASPSFSLFKDYKEKGNLFKKYVKLYGR